MKLSNDRVTISVSEAEWASRVAAAQRSGYRPASHSAENWARGLLLSEACRKLDQFERLQELMPPTAEEILREAEDAAKFRLVADHLAEHTHYAEGETLSRWLTGRIMSEGMGAEIARALAVARATLAREPERIEAEIPAARRELTSTARHLAGRCGAQVPSWAVA